jgi:methyl-accepting chemotaxis protein
MKLKIGAKIGLGFGVILALMAISSITAYLKTAEVKTQLERTFQMRIPQVEAAKGIQSLQQYAASKTRQCILAGSDRERYQAALKAWEHAWETLDKSFASLNALVPQFTIQENKNRVASVGERLPNLRAIQKTSMEIAASGVKDAVTKGGNNYTDVGTPFNDAISKTLTELTDSADEQLKKDEQAILDANHSLYLTLMISTALSLVIGILVALFISRQISRSTNSVLHQAEAIAGGDLSGDELKITSKDEMGDLSAAINRMHASLRKVIQSISENSQNVANASEEFSSVSQQISANSEETSAQANAVSTATEEVNRNLHTVATATEEMSASISEIAKNATEAAKVAAEAMRTANETNAIVGKLGVSSAEIGQVIKTITSIAQKTDLLALNATVEAARAGEVGAGFAVVANEVKELAKQTAAATEDISRKIEAIQVDTKGAVQAITTITGVITRVNEISGTIAAAVEEQSATTNEMSRNLTDAAKGATQVTENIGGVAQAAQNTSHGATDSLKAAQQLAQLSHKLRQLVEQFKLERGGSADRRPLGSVARSYTEQQSGTERHDEVLVR